MGSTYNSLLTTYDLLATIYSLLLTTYLLLTAYYLLIKGGWQAAHHLHRQGARVRRGRLHRGPTVHSLRRLPGRPPLWKARPVWCGLGASAAQEADWPRLAAPRCRPGHPLGLAKPARVPFQPSRSETCFKRRRHRGAQRASAPLRYGHARLGARLHLHRARGGLSAIDEQRDLAHAT